MYPQTLSRPLPGAAALLWPKRAVKACTSCRRDKIRCDDTRPCNGCRRKGFSEAQCIDGCERCRRARVRCEGGTPCVRCTDLQLECFDDQTTLHLPKPATAAGRGAPGRPSERAKLACRSCRRDNKKCEDQRPCGRCMARNEECVHVGRGPKLVKVRCQFCREGNRRCEDARPCKFCVERGGECIDPPRKGKGHGTRVKAACVNCRRDKVRCDGTRPCGACDKKGLQCCDRPSKSSSPIDSRPPAEYDASASSSPELPHASTSQHGYFDLPRSTSTLPHSPDSSPAGPMPFLSLQYHQPPRYTIDTPPQLHLPPQRHQLPRPDRLPSSSSLTGMMESFGRLSAAMDYRDMQRV
ncbi:hypothetical protein DENSPDRAFT_678259 [Dentipellis sp. KUC8613]|nr:hypothetical protein DENSPDRAFT_678259 [Dentipellis sp. KUC8613]